MCIFFNIDYVILCIDISSFKFGFAFREKLKWENHAALFPSFTTGPKIAKFIFDEEMEEILINEDRKEEWKIQRVTI